VLWSGSISSNSKDQIQGSDPELLDRGPKSDRGPHIPSAGTPEVQESNSVYEPATALDASSMPSPSLESSSHVQPQNQSWQKHAGGIGFRVRRKNGWHSLPLLAIHTTDNYPGELLYQIQGSDDWLSEEGFNQYCQVNGR
jgi:hypothetical protein